MLALAHAVGCKAVGVGSDEVLLLPENEGVAEERALYEPLPLPLEQPLAEREGAPPLPVASGD